MQTAPCVSDADPDPLDGIKPATAPITIGELDAEVEFICDGRHSLTVEGIRIGGDLIPANSFSSAVQTRMHVAAWAAVERQRELMAEPA
jgi:hypothetical protein